jgi:hypothetical protein
MAFSDELPSSCKPFGSAANNTQQEPYADWVRGAFFHRT